MPTSVTKENIPTQQIHFNNFIFNLEMKSVVIEQHTTLSLRGTMETANDVKVKDWQKMCMWHQMLHGNFDQPYSPVSESMSQ